MQRPMIRTFTRVLTLGDGVGQHGIFTWTPSHTIRRGHRPTRLLIILPPRPPSFYLLFRPTHPPPPTPPFLCAWPFSATPLSCPFAHPCPRPLPPSLPLLHPLCSSTLQKQVDEFCHSAGLWQTEAWRHNQRRRASALRARECAHVSWSLT